MDPSHAPQVTKKVPWGLCVGVMRVYIFMDNFLQESLKPRTRSGHTVAHQVTKPKPSSLQATSTVHP